jgi:nucleoside-diphosphate-sugar epimerase
LVYNNAKVRAEWELEKLQENGKVEVVRLRPSVVFGPRSRWISDYADALLSNGALWINHGSAICNTIYVDNLVHAARLACEEPKAVGRAFLVGDDQVVTWRDFLLPIAKQLGFGPDRFQEMTPPSFPPERESRWDAFTLTKTYGNLSGLIPERPKRILKAIIAAWPQPINVSSYRLPCQKGVTMSHEMSLLQQCGWRLTNVAANQAIGYSPKVSFAEGMKQSLSWLDYLELKSTRSYKL